MAGDILTADSYEIWLVSGDSRQEHLLKSFQSRQFQTTLAAQLDRNKAITVGKYGAALGTRGDFFLIKIPCTNTALAAATAKAEINNMYIELADIKNVMPDVQLSKAKGGYGAMSPFESHMRKITKDMQRGISSEKLSVLNNVTTSGNTTYASQKVGGVTDERFQTKFDVTVAADTDNIFYLRMKPTASNVLVIRPDSNVWVLYPNIVTQNGFVEIAD